MPKEAWKRRITLLLVSQVISMFGSSLVQFALVWAITLRTQSGTMAMMATVFGTLPQVFLAPFAGVWADRFSRKKLIILSDALIALVTLIMAVLFWFGLDEFWMFFLIMAIRSAGAAVQQPALSAMLPQIVPQEHLTRINGLNGSIHSLVSLASPVLGGVLYALARLEYIFMIDVVTAAIAIVTLIRFIPVPPHARALERVRTRYFADMKDGIIYIRQHKMLFELFVFSGVFMFFIAPDAMLAPLQVTRNFGPDVWHLTLTEIAFSTGMVIGGLTVSFWKGLRNRIRSIILSIALMGAVTIAISQIRVFWIYLAFMLVFGSVLPFFNTPATVLIHEQVEEAYLGRVFSVVTVFSSTIWPLSMVLFGPLADHFNINSLFLICGLVVIAIALVMSTRRDLIAAGRPSVSGCAAGGEANV